MTGDAPKKDWFEEFKKVNPHSQPLPSAPPSGRSERRKHPRFELSEAKAKLYRRGATALFGLARLNIEGNVVDLSEGGARISTGERLLADTKIHIRLEIAKFEDRIESDGLTRWCHQDPKDESVFFVGLVFTGLDPSTLKKIALMRTWFTSPKYLVLREQRLRDEKRR